VVVNDGSGDAFDALFRSVARLPNVCEHAINLAKGAALRTVMHVCLTPSVTRRGSSPSTPTVNTTPRTPAASAIGSTRSLARWSSSVRWFLGTVRLRSRIGNILTRWLFHVLLTERMVGPTARHLIAVRASFGAACVIKTSTFPVTVAALCAGVVLSAIADRYARPANWSWQAAIRAALIIGATAAESDAAAPRAHRRTPDLARQRPRRAGCGSQPRRRSPPMGCNGRSKG
jgi:hypothetical protein